MLLNMVKITLALLPLLATVRSEDYKYYGRSHQRNPTSQHAHSQKGPMLWDMLEAKGHNSQTSSWNNGHKNSGYKHSNSYGGSQYYRNPEASSSDGGKYTPHAYYSDNKATEGYKYSKGAYQSSGGLKYSNGGSSGGYKYSNGAYQSSGGYKHSNGAYQSSGGYKHSNGGYKTSMTGYSTHGYSTPTPIPCNGVPEYFESQVLVEFNGDPDLVTEEDIASLEETFGNTYNLLSTKLCDDHFRTVHHVTALDQGGSPIIPRGGLNFCLLFYVVGECRGCDSYSYLFSPPLDDRRMLSSLPNSVQIQRKESGKTLEERGSSQLRPSSNEKTASTEGNGDNHDSVPLRSLHETGYSGHGPDIEHRGLHHGKGGKKGHGKKGVYRRGKGNRGNSGSNDGLAGKGKGKGKGGYMISGSSGSLRCVCHSPYPELRAPTEEEFAEAFNSNILDAAEDVQVLDEVVELERVPCEEDKNLFDTTLDILYLGTFSQMTASELVELQDNIRGVYNRLIDKRCDLSFRDVVDLNMVQITPMGNTFTVKYEVELTCRGCGAGTTMFDNGGRRALSGQDWGYEWGTALEDSCFCPVFFPEFGAPTEGDFEDAFSDVVDELIEFQILPNLNGVLQVTEAAGSPLPTLPPVDPGVREPSAQPSAEPSLSSEPSSTPSSSPSASPSAEPSAAPSLSSEPSAAPSPIPTISGGTSRSNEPSVSSAPSRPPSLSTMPSQSLSPSNAPSVFSAPSSKPSLSSMPSMSNAPSQSSAPSAAPSESNAPSQSAAPSNQPSLSASPSSSPSQVPSYQPSQSLAPSLSSAPSDQPSQSAAPSNPPSRSLQPSQSNAPSESSSPSDQPSKSSAPSQSSAPSAAPSESNAPSRSAAPSASPSDAPSGIS